MEAIFQVNDGDYCGRWMNGLFYLERCSCGWLTIDERRLLSASARRASWCDVEGFKQAGPLRTIRPEKSKAAMKNAKMVPLPSL